MSRIVVECIRFAYQFTLLLAAPYCRRPLRAQTFDIHLKNESSVPPVRDTQTNMTIRCFIFFARWILFSIVVRIRASRTNKTKV